MANLHPAITFRVNLTIPLTTVVGNGTNERESGWLHPDMCVYGQDVGRAALASRANRRAVWLTSIVGAGNLDYKHGDEFTLYGLHAINVRDLYAFGYASDSQACLDVVSYE